MNYGEIKKTDIANGIGVRVTLFVSGCTRHCKNCFNAETWDFNYGKPFTKETEDEVLAALAPGFINGLTLLGGEPMEPQNQRALVPFLHRVRKLYPEKDIWCYSGSTLETDMLKDGGRNRCEVTDEFLSLLDVLVDGAFVDELKDISLRFRGSSNQRIIDVPKTLQSGVLTLWDERANRESYPLERETVKSNRKRRSTAVFRTVPGGIFYFSTRAATQEFKIS